MDEWERPSMRLARLWHRQGERAEAERVVLESDLITTKRCVESRRTQNG